MPSPIAVASRTLLIVAELRTFHDHRTFQIPLDSRIFLSTTNLRTDSRNFLIAADSRTFLISIVDRPAGLDENREEAGGELYAGLVEEERAAYGARVVTLHTQLIVADNTGGGNLRSRGGVACAIVMNATHIQSRIANIVNGTDNIQTSPDDKYEGIKKQSHY